MSAQVYSQNNEMREREKKTRQFNEPNKSYQT